MAKTKSNPATPATVKARASAKGVKTAAKYAKKGNNSRKCDLIFPVGRCNRLLKHGRYAQQVGKGAGIFSAAVLEYLVTEILEMAGHCAHEGKKKTIMPKHLQMAMKGDSEFSKLLGMSQLSQGGTQPNINAFLFPKKGKKEVEQDATQEM